MWVPIGVKYGLSVEEFYRLNPKKILRYQPFLLARFKAEKDIDSERGWVHGNYVARAIGAVMPKGKRYPEHPIQFYETRTEEEQQFSDVERFRAFAEMFNKANEGRFKKKQEEQQKESSESQDNTGDQNETESQNNTGDQNKIESQ